MLKDKSSSAIVAVSDMARSKKFYLETLGLPLADDSMGDSVLSFRAGDTELVVYKSDFAGTNKAYAVVWGNEIETIVQALKSKSVRFEHYEGMERDGDIHTAGDFKAVWFKDPDGNILHLNNM